VNEECHGEVAEPLFDHFRECLDDDAKTASDTATEQIATVVATLRRLNTVWPVTIKTWMETAQALLQYLRQG